MLERILTNIFKGILYSLIFGLFGGLLGKLILGWTFVKGAYVLILALGTLSLCIAIVFMVGTPKMRYEFFTKRRYKPDPNDPETIDEGGGLGKGAVAPGIIGVVMIILGFAIEAFFHQVL
jgi:hypothetical protein